MTHDCTADDLKPHDALGTRLGGAFLTGLVAAIARRARERRAVRNLTGMDDHLLRDIGVNREEIDLIVHGGKVDRADGGRVQPVSLRPGRSL